MPAPTSVSLFSREALMALVRIRDERDSGNVLAPYFPARLEDGDKVTVRTMIRRPQRVRHTTRDGKGYAVQPGTMSETTYAPAWFKPQAMVKAADMEAFLAADAARGQQDSRSQARVQSAMQKLMDLLDPLLDDIELEKKHAMAGALQGSYSYKLDGTTETVSYGLAALTAPSTSWTDAAATIQTDFPAALREFEDVYGVECDTIFYSPNTAQDFAKNTAIKALMAGSEVYSRALLEQTLNPVTGGPLGTAVGIGPGIRWVPVKGKSTPVGGGSLSDIWDRTKIVLANSARMGGAWSMTYSETYGINTTTPNVEILEPPKGSDVKSPLVQTYFNGLPTFQRPDCVATLTVEF